jgi:riboflavin biosynthesis pyrimidine reductase
MPGILRASISLDGKLLTEAGKPSRRAIPDARFLSVEELLLTIYPLIIGNDSIPTISGLPGGFLARDLTWELVSVSKGAGGVITARYRRKLRARKASRPTRVGS